MNKIHEWVNTGLIGLVLILVLVGGNQSVFGASGSRFPNGISADSTSPNSGQVRGTTLTVTGASTLTGDATFGGGDDAVIITHTNTATSSLEVGCIQGYATSTATAVRMAFGSIATTSTLHGGGDSIGHVMWQYGTCPR